MGDQADVLADTYAAAHAGWLDMRPACAGCSRPVMPSNQLGRWVAGGRVETWHRGCFIEAVEDGALTTTAAGQ